MPDQNTRGASRRGYCLNCFALVAADAEICSRCGNRAALLGERGYKEKLLHALSHPLSEVRMRAIIALGKRGEKDAAPTLVACALRHPTDVVEGLEIVRSLGRLDFGRPCKPALRELARSHSGRPVRSAASRVLAGERERPARARAAGRRSRAR